jgi:hypothetical protein
MYNIPDYSGLYTNTVHPDICEDSRHFAQMWKALA